MQIVSALMAMFSVLIPVKLWFAPDQPIAINIKSDVAISLVLTTFDGKRVDSKGSIDVPANSTEPVDVRQMYPTLSSAGTFLLFAVPKGGAPADFLGTPLVIEVMADQTPGAPPGPMVVRVEPLRDAVMTTDAGPLTMAFYYDAAPNTVDSFLHLSSEGFYDGLTFHRIIPHFVLQGGDPRGDGTGGPGYKIRAEFNDRPHEAGVLSMARNGDPEEAPGVMPRNEYADSAGSQFFICLDYEKTKHLDRRYTAFGKVVDGMDAVKKIAATPLVDEQAGRPVTPQVIQKVQVFSVTPGHNPYATIINIGTTAATTKPAE